MAGEVRTDPMHVHMLGGGHRLDLVARVCPAVERYGRICCALDSHTAIVRVCPFLYGLVIDQAVEEARSVDEIRRWLATDELGIHRSYTVRCLRKESKGVEPGVPRQP